MTEMQENPEVAEIRIRSANVSDAPVLAEYRYAFRSNLDVTIEGKAEFVRRCRLWMEARLGSDVRWQCWVAERNQIVLGHLWLQLIEKIPNPVSEPETHAYVTNVFVCEEAREKGIGSRLMFVALEWCKQRDVHAVILWPTPRSRSLYLRHGFSVREDLLELILNEHGPETAAIN